MSTTGINYYPKFLDSFAKIKTHQTMIKLLPMEQSDNGLHFLQIFQNLEVAHTKRQLGKIIFWGYSKIVLGVHFFRICALPVNDFSTGAPLPNDYFIVTSSVLLPLYFNTLSPIKAGNKGMTLLLNVDVMYMLHMPTKIVQIAIF